MGPLRFYLASASPRRLELLREIGVDPRCVPADLDEAVAPGESPRRRVLRLAEAKGRAVAERLRGEPAGLILAADTAVVIDGEDLGKPADAAAAETMLQRLRGRDHDVLTGVFLLRTDDGRHHAGVDATLVRFREYDRRTIRAYVASGEPLDKAGAYGIQGRGAALLVQRIEGSWSNVVGLPLERLPEWMGKIGLDLLDLLRSTDRPPG
jgi:septum formation protein